MVRFDWTVSRRSLATSRCAPKTGRVQRSRQQHLNHGCQQRGERQQNPQQHVSLQQRRRWQRRPGYRQLPQRQRQRQQSQRPRHQLQHQQQPQEKQQRHRRQRRRRQRRRRRPGCLVMRWRHKAPSWVMTLWDQRRHTRRAPWRLRRMRGAVTWPEWSWPWSSLASCWPSCRPGVGWCTPTATRSPSRDSGWSRWVYANHQQINKSAKRIISPLYFIWYKNW